MATNFLQVMHHLLTQFKSRSLGCKRLHAASAASATPAWGLGNEMEDKISLIIPSQVGQHILHMFTSHHTHLVKNPLKIAASTAVSLYFQAVWLNSGSKLLSPSHPVKLHFIGRTLEQDVYLPKRMCSQNPFPRHWMTEWWNAGNLGWYIKVTRWCSFP